MAAGMNLPQFPAIAVGTLGLIGLGLGGPGGGGLAGGVANNIVLLRGLPPLIAPLVPPLLTNPWTAVGLGLFIAALSGPIQSLGGYLGDRVGKLESQIWGSLANRKNPLISVIPTNADENSITTGSVSATGITYIDSAGYFSYYNYSSGQLVSAGPGGAGPRLSYSNVKTAYYAGIKGSTGQNQAYALKIEFSNGSDPAILGPIGGESEANGYMVLLSGSVALSPQDGAGVPVSGQYGAGFTYLPNPAINPDYKLAEVETVPIPKPAPTPAYAPGQAPTTVPDITTVPVPGTEEDGTSTNPRRPVIAPPLTPEKPTPFPPIIPKPDTGTIGDLGPDGKPKPKPSPDPPVTDVDTHFVNGNPITTGQPRTDLESVAKEVGRIENKVAMVMQSPIQSGNLLEDLTNLLNLAELLLSLLDATTPGGSYTLSSPCVLDEEDQRIVSEVEYGGGPVLNRLESKMDAVAQLLQVHKDLKQPGCDGPVPSGNVTVTFTEVV